MEKNGHTYVELEDGSTLHLCCNVDGLPTGIKETPLEKAIRTGDMKGYIDSLIIEKLYPS